jgi:hypothetical protein
MKKLSVHIPDNEAAGTPKLKFIFAYFYPHDASGKN